MAQLKSVAAVSLIKGDTEIYEVSSTTPYIKLNELIIANTSSDQVTCVVKVFKSDIAQEVTIIANSILLAHESKILPLGTCLNAGDKLIISNNVNKAIDVLVSCVEM